MESPAEDGASIFSFLWVIRIPSGINLPAQALLPNYGAHLFSQGLIYLPTTCLCFHIHLHYHISFHVFVLSLITLFHSLLKILPVFQHCDTSCLQKIPLSCQGIHSCLVFCNATWVLLNTEFNTFFFKKTKDELKWEERGSCISSEVITACVYSSHESHLGAGREPTPTVSSWQYCNMQPKQGQ